ncbi:hypothetical protein CORC01_07384 [Colletotrichum orchidophilum]|uniref:BTB domain-containing protein n=1 Tax=Colletotrichum orchidophilum TaxID=1209926 RepID=A0A1G4B7A8_9PEZI|nr:uncharacterized protein CORC01_07384 [Colletotrichum orchidophilum]OHE97329.1 hypothetical protein CORC01_07384 [Colletotrichum orchidophilum]
MDGITKSRIIKFIVGKDKVEHNVHEAVISGLSEPLRALVNNGMKESVEGLVVWTSVEDETFTHLMEYAYRHDFTFVDHDAKTTYASETTESLNQRVKGYRLPRKSRSKGIDFALDCFGDFMTDVEGDPHLVRSHSQQCFISCARLYVLADQYAIYELKDLCVDKLRQIPLHHPYTDELALSICKLLVFAWPRTIPNDTLRALLIDYIITDLYKALGFSCVTDVLDEIPEISTALLRRAPDDYWLAL